MQLHGLRNTPLVYYTLRSLPQRPVLNNHLTIQLNTRYPRAEEILYKGSDISYSRRKHFRPDSLTPRPPVVQDTPSQLTDQLIS